MNEKGQITSVNRSEETSAGDREKTLQTPYFDAAAVERARPAVPLSQVKPARSWPATWLLAIAILSGLAGGLLGGLLPTLFLKKDAPPQTSASQPGSTGTTVAVEDSSPDSKQSDAQNNQEQGLRGSPEAVGEASGTESVVAEEQPDTGSARPEAVTKEMETALHGALNDWVAATNARDLDRQMMFYNPVVEAFYRSRNASRADVRRDKARVFERASSVDIRAGAPAIRLSPDGRTAIMLFHKRYEIVGGGEDRRGEVVQELRWQRINGEWRIISERDLRVVR